MAIIKPDLDQRVALLQGIEMSGLYQPTPGARYPVTPLPNRDRVRARQIEERA